MKEALKKTKPKEEGSLTSATVQSTKANGSTTNKTDLAFNSGQTTNTTKEIGYKAQRLVKGNYFFLTVPTTKVIFKIMNGTDKDNTTGTKNALTKACGSTTKNQEEEC